MKKVIIPIIGLILLLSVAVIVADVVVKVGALKNAQKNEAFRRKNLWLDALGHVWCSGGCEGGMNRYGGGEVTEEQVRYLERNAERARTYLASRYCRFARERGGE